MPLFIMNVFIFDTFIGTLTYSYFIGTLPLPFCPLPVVSPLLLMKRPTKTPVSHVERFLCFSLCSVRALLSNCCLVQQGIMGFGIWHLPTGANSHLRAVSTGCKPCDDESRWSLNDNKQKSIA